MNGFASSTLPRLRNLDIRPHIHNGHPHILLRDPLNLSDQTLLVPQPLAVVLSLCDGTRSASEMARTFSSVYGVSIDVGTVESLLAALDGALLLDNERSHDALNQARDRYRAQDFRQPFLAGQSYPATASALRNHLDDYVRQTKDTASVPSPTRSEIRGLLSPHIDYYRGGETYAHVWNRAAEAVRAADLIIILATDHYGDDPLTLTRQNYATPYGILPTATQIVDRLAQVLENGQAYAGELRHIGEHSIELVVNWLHHMRDGKACEIVPILCGSYRHFSGQVGRSPNGNVLGQTVSILREETVKRNAVIVASGDMSHVGSAFGGKPLDSAKRTTVQIADEKLIHQMCVGDSSGFLAEIQSASDAFNVCGAAPIYLTMQTLGDVEGEMTSYATCPADETDTSAVTISGIVFRSSHTRT